MTKATEQFTIPKRWSWLAAITVSIECDPLAPMGVKMGLAVRVAYETGADLTGADLRDADLTGAVLRGAVLRGADLRDADLTGADLTGAALTGADLRGAVLRDAVLRGADLRGEKIERLLASANRLDGYAFYGFQLQAGGVKIAAGCRCFTCAEFRAHVAVAYPDTDKARETLRIIDFIEGRAADLGVALEPVVEQAA
jgi:uncharacterized protein YjbI with pentapeptide repeats